MSASHVSEPLDRYTAIGTLGSKVRNAVKRMLLPLCVVLAVETMYLAFSGRPGAAAFLLICAGSCLSLKVWSSSAIGLPLLPLMIVQSLIIYGVPIAVGHEVIFSYPPNFVFSAGVEVLIFDVSMILAWKLGMQLFRPAPATCYVLQNFDKSGATGMSRLGFGMIGAATGYEVMESLNLTRSIDNALPAGASSIVAALVSVVSACGFFLVSMTIGGSEAPILGKFVFWGLLVVNGMISASEFLLYGVAANIITVAIGFFWSSGRMPWRYLILSMMCLSFLNTGKTTMRERYWGNDDEPAAQFTFDKLPAIYAEWIGVSYDAILENQSVSTTNAAGTRAKENKNQTLLDRIDNMQNLLFVIDAIETEHVSLLHGATYSLIPPLLVPRILWPDKPRSHEGQVMLNVHFGRQDLYSTFATYIAWGLLPEAYGNFGPVMGAVFIGSLLGICFAWIENYTARKMFLSMEGLLSLSLLMSLMNSFEMVASVLVTAIFQSFVIVIAACAPFVRWTANVRPIEDDDSPPQD
jgi:hypothetical protein